MVLKNIELKVRDFMATELITRTSDVLFPVAVSIMANNGIGNLIIEENGKPSSLLTEREILSYLVRRGEIPVEPIKNVLTQSFTSISPELSITDAAKLMITKKKRLLVIDDKKLVGIITASDILRAFRKTGGNPSLDNVMSTKIQYCTHSDSIFNAIKIMYKKRIGSVIVTKNGLPFGIFTERDLLVNVLSQTIALTERIDKYCSSPLTTAKIGILGNDAARLMTVKKIKRLALTEKGNIVGIVTSRDIVEAFYAE